MKTTLELYEIDEIFCEKLSKIDKKVVNCSGEKNRRPFVGILIKVKNKNYFAPLSSPKTKHKNMKTNMDFMKIDRGELGVINFNNMIPVELKFIRKIDPEQLPQETDEEMKYKNMLCKQLSWINETKNKFRIILKATKLREKFINSSLPENIKNRCVDFVLLENVNI